MALFLTTNNSSKQLKKHNFRNEKELQSFVEKNMGTLFGIRFLATEFTTSKQHGGRIDSLGLDENNSPVIIEYKYGEKDNIINQGLFYLDWLVDHKGDFQLLVQNKLKNNVKVDFGSPRVLLVAQTFSKYDKYAINRMSENIELWAYSKYEENIFELKLVASSQAKKTTNSVKQISKVNYSEYSIEDHLKNKNDKVRELFLAIQEKIFSLESEQKIEENPRKVYLAYKSTRNFLYMMFQSKKIKLYFPFKIKIFNDKEKRLYLPPKGLQDAGFFAGIDFESFDDLDYIVRLIDQSYIQSI